MKKAQENQFRESSDTVSSKFRNFEFIGGRSGPEVINRFGGHSGF